MLSLTIHNSSCEEFHKSKGKKIVQTDLLQCSTINCISRFHGIAGSSYKTFLLSYICMYVHVCVACEARCTCR